MQAITIKNFGGPEVLTMSDIPMPTPGPEQLLVRVKATALNRADLLQRRGNYPPPSGESDILGVEIAGEVTAVGDQVTQYKPGQRVFGLVGSGGYAEYCVIDQFTAMPIPENLDFVAAAAVPEAFLTANEAVFTLGNLQKNESILIHAGASGVGSAAIQLAKQAGATVFTTVRSPEKIEKIKSLGADFISNQIPENQTVDVIIDFIGASYFAQNIQSLKPGGRLICVGLMGGAKTEINLDQVLMRRLQIKGLIMRMRSLADKRAITQRFSSHWLPLFSAGKIHPIVDSVFPLSEARQAHERMESNANVGKIVLRVD